MLTSIIHNAPIPMSDFSNRKLIRISHRFLSHYMTRLSSSNQRKRNLWRLRVWSCSLYNILYSVLSTWFLNFFGSRNVCSNIFEELLVTTEGADSSLLVRDTVSFVEDFRRFILDDLKLKEDITTIRDVGKYPVTQRWQASTQKHFPAATPSWKLSPRPRSKHEKRTASSAWET